MCRDADILLSRFRNLAPSRLNLPIFGFSICEPRAREISDLCHLYSTCSVVPHANRWLPRYRLSRPRNFWLKSLWLQLANLRVHDMPMPLVAGPLRGSLIFGKSPSCPPLRSLISCPVGKSGNRNRDSNLRAFYVLGKPDSPMN
jgi:hypothetical protein